MSMIDEFTNETINDAKKILITELTACKIWVEEHEMNKDICTRILNMLECYDKIDVIQNEWQESEEIKVIKDWFGKELFKRLRPHPEVEAYLKDVLQ